MTHLKSLFKGSLIAASLLCTGMVSAHESHHKTSHTLSALDKAIAGEHRSDKNKKRDMYRNPKETLEFFGFKSSMTVVEVSPGGAWYSEILAPALKGQGKFYGAQYPDTGEDNYYSKSRKRLEKKLASNAIFSEMMLTDFTPKKQSVLAPKGSADLVLTFRNLHNWGEEGVEQLFKDAFVALKPGGAMGVVEHRMPESQDWKKNKKSGYVPTTMVLKLAKEAGFKLAASSEINANAKDTAMHPKGVWTLPPVLALKEQDKAKYVAIGESDRMTLKFVKPGAKL